MKLSAEYRHEAATRTKPFAGTLAIICLIFVIITGIINFSIEGEPQYIGDVEYTTSTQPLAFLMIFVGGAFALSRNKLAQKVYLGQKPEVKDLFYGFKDFKRGFVSYVLMDIYLTLWALITLGIGAIIKTYSYSMTYFLLEENPDLGANEAITLSRKLMDGKKWKLFCLDFSYIGWHLLSVFTLGILTLWITPRVETARYLFFKDVYEENNYKINAEKVVEEVAIVDLTKENEVDEPKNTLNDAE